VKYLYLVSYCLKNDPCKIHIVKHTKVGIEPTLPVSRPTIGPFNVLYYTIIYTWPLPPTVHPIARPFVLSYSVTQVLVTCNHF